MSRAANKRRRYAIDKPTSRTYSREEQIAWNTGYTDSSKQQAAIANGEGKGSQRKKRDKLQYGIRIGNGTDANGKQRYQTVRADKSTGAFLEPNESKSYIQPGGYARAINTPARIRNESTGDFRSIPTPEKTRKVRGIS
jgi:hypothetical protein